MFKHSPVLREILQAFGELGGQVTYLSQTTIPIVQFKKKSYVFVEEFGVHMPFLYEKVFQKKTVWKKILSDGGIRKFTQNAGVYSVCITRSGFINVLQKHPPFLIGDGQATLKELIARENMKRLNTYSPFLYPIRIRNRLSEDELSQIVKRGEMQGISYISSMQEGATFSDVTMRIHANMPSFAEQVLSCFPHLPYIVLDLNIRNQTFRIHNVSVTIGSHIAYPMYNGHLKQRAAAVFVDLILTANKQYEH
jgi:hypothetical protein